MTTKFYRSKKVYENIKCFKKETQHILIWTEDKNLKCLNCNNEFSCFSVIKGIRIIGTCTCSLQCSEIIIKDIIE